MAAAQATTNTSSSGKKSRPTSLNPVSEQTPANPNTLVLRKEIPGVVYIHQTVDMRAAEDTLMTLDGEPAPSLLLKNVTLGLVIDQAGHIVTRLVGVSPSNPPLEVNVLGQGINKPFAAKFVGLDSVTGLCVLKIESNPFKPAPFAEATFLPAQQAVKIKAFHPQQGQSQSSNLALVRPRIFSFDGLIAKAVNDFRFTSHNPLYQLLAPAITPVQDCSPVFSNDGTLFGVAIYDTNSEGQSVVYPLTRVLDIVAKVVKSNESLAYGWLGATPDLNMSAPIQTTPNSPVKPELGVRVRDVFPDSPAEQAGIKPRDILLSINDRRVESNAQLTTALRQLPPDSEIAVRIKRDSEYKIVKARLVPSPALEPSQMLPALLNRLEKMKSQLSALSPNDPKRSSLQDKVETMDSIMKGIARPSPPDVKLRVYYGLEVQPLTAQLQEFFGTTHGVLIAAVAANQRAAQSGLVAGDLLIAIGEKKISDLASLLQALDEAAEATELTVLRQQATLKLKLQR